MCITLGLTKALSRLVDLLPVATRCVAKERAPHRLVNPEQMCFHLGKGEARELSLGFYTSFEADRTFG